ncbi:MAG TPA: sulfur carrier protein ThiS [bacterium]
MEIVLNGAARHVADAMNLRALLESLKLPTLEQGIAVAVNGEIVRKTEWRGTVLKASDEIEVVQATQGG